MVLRPLELTCGRNVEAFGTLSRKPLECRTQWAVLVGAQSRMPKERRSVRTAILRLWTGTRTLSGTRLEATPVVLWQRYAWHPHPETLWGCKSYRGNIWAVRCSNCITFISAHQVCRKQQRKNQTWKTCSLARNVYVKVELKKALLPFFSPCNGTQGLGIELSDRVPAWL